MAAYIGEATESLAHFTGPRIGGLLNATLGNAAELIITIVAIRAGLLELVKASITGSILGNLLLVMGFSFRGRRRQARTPGLRQAQRQPQCHPAGAGCAGHAHPVAVQPFHRSGYQPEGGSAQPGRGSVMMIILYVLGLLDAARSGDTPVTHEPAPASVLPHWSVTKSIIILVLATARDRLALRGAGGRGGTGRCQPGCLRILPGHHPHPHHRQRGRTPGGGPVCRAEQDGPERGNFRLLQPADRPAGGPCLVFLSLALGHPLTLIFNTFELLALIAGVLIAALVSADGESSWLEGVALVAIYIILGLAFFLLPV